MDNEYTLTIHVPKAANWDESRATDFANRVAELGGEFGLNAGDLRITGGCQQPLVGSTGGTSRI